MQTLQKGLLHRGHVTSSQSTPTNPARLDGNPSPRDHVMPEMGWGCSLVGEQLGSVRGLLMNMQTQIDLFPLGTCYYSQILIRLQIPPVPAASSPFPPQARTPAPRRLRPQNRHQQKEGYPGPHGAASQGERLVLRQEGCESRESESCCLTGGQLTEPSCHVLHSSRRGTAAAAAEAETGLVTLGKRKPTCFQLSPNQPPDYDGNKSQSQP